MRPDHPSSADPDYGPVVDIVLESQELVAGQNPGLDVALFSVLDSTPCVPGGEGHERSIDDLITSLKMMSSAISVCLPGHFRGGRPVQHRSFGSISCVLEFEQWHLREIHLVRDSPKIGGGSSCLFRHSPS
jgi:hypothetical protein